MRQTVTAIMADVADATAHKRVANNTVRYDRANGDTVWRLHNTDVVTKHADGSFTLNSGGWRTVTTKDRINAYAPIRLTADKGAWWIGGWRDTNRVPFYDGIKIGADGKPVANGLDGAVIVADAAATRKAIAKFCKLVDTVDKLPLPNNGDCWFCMMKPEATRDAAAADLGFGGSAAIDDDHIREHIEEGYLHGALLRNAMLWAGYADSQIRIHYVMKLRGTFKRTLRRYLQRKLGVG